MVARMKHEEPSSPLYYVVVGADFHIKQRPAVLKFLTAIVL